MIGTSPDQESQVSYTLSSLRVCLEVMHISPAHTPPELSGAYRRDSFHGSLVHSYIEMLVTKMAEISLEKWDYENCCITPCRVLFLPDQMVRSR